MELIERPCVPVLLLLSSILFLSSHMHTGLLHVFLWLFFVAFFLGALRWAGPYQRTETRNMSIRHCRSPCAIQAAQLIDRDS